MPSNPMMNEASKLLTFADVLSDEIQDLKGRRDKLCSQEPWKQASPPPANSSYEDTVRHLRRSVLQNDCTGLALSGGGIRSATFNLGVLQGLSELGLLKRFDYLSTVSGGGYIGGWLTAWIKREGDIENVEKQLHPNHVEEAKAFRWRGQTPVRMPDKRIVAYQKPILDDEPEAIRHLRSYSNYLAPRLGLLSADGWVLIAIYLRNLLLNQLVFVLGVLALLFGVAFFIQAFAVAAHTENLHAGVSVFVGILAFLALSIACLRVRRSILDLQETAQGESHDGESIRTGIRRLHSQVLIPLLIAAVAVSLLAVHLLDPQSAKLERRFGFEFAGAFALFHTLFNFGSWKQLLWDWKLIDPRWLLSGLVAGAFGGFLLYLLVVKFNAWTPDPGRVPLATAFLPPLLLALFVCTTFVQLGVLGPLPREAEREWWSSLCGWVLMYAAGWLVLFSTAIFGTYLVLSAQHAPWMARATAALSWVASVGGGLWAGHSSQSGSPKALRPDPGLGTCLTELLARVAPAIFLLGMFILLSVFAAILIEGDLPNGDTFLKHLDNPNGPTTLESWSKEYAWCWMLVFLLSSVGVLLGASLLVSRCVDVNVFSLQGLYANRLIRCYLGASRRKKPGDINERSPGAALNSHGPPRNPNAITGFDPLDDLPLNALCIQTEGVPNSAPRPEEDNQARPYRGPLPLICTSLNLVQGEELAWQERKAESFTLSPYHCGSESTGYRPTAQYGNGLSLGAAMAISGAALSPNMGYHSEPAITALLTVFNVRLGAWLGNPRKEQWRRSSPAFGLWYLVAEALGRTNARSKYIYLSDGGHFENLGVYELIRRRCRFILLCDAGADRDFAFADLGSLVRKVRIDLGVRIDLDVRALQPHGPERHALSHVAVGKINYGDVDRSPDAPQADKDDRSFNPDNDEGILVYIKPALTGDEPQDVLNYSKLQRDYPHQTTLDQFFTESQFESYRALGYHSVMAAFCDAIRARGGPKPPSSRGLYRTLFEYWSASLRYAASNYLETSRRYIEVHMDLRRDDRLRWLAAEIYPEAPGSHELLQSRQNLPDVLVAERHMVAQMFTVLEDAWSTLRLDQYREQSEHPGWMGVFRRWLNSPTVREHWKQIRAEFSPKFGNFIDGLK